MTTTLSASSSEVMKNHPEMCAYSAYLRHILTDCQTVSPKVGTHGVILNNQEPKCMAAVIEMKGPGVNTLPSSNHIQFQRPLTATDQE